MFSGTLPNIIVVLRFGKTELNNNSTHQSSPENRFNFRLEMAQKTLKKGNHRRDAVFFLFPIYL